MRAARLTRASLALALLAMLAWLPGAAHGAPIKVKAVNVSSETGLKDRAHTYAATAADIDRNGFDDVFLVRHFESFPQLFLNNGGAFTNVTETSFPTAPNKRDYHHCPAADVDLDGDVDIYCTHGGGGGGNGFKPNELWLQGLGLVFSEHAEEWGVRDGFGRGRGATFINANGDARPDLYVANAFPRKDGRRGPNRLFINAKKPGFRHASGFKLNRRVGGNFPQALDYDGDGREDLAVCGQEHLVFYRNLRNRRFRNQSSKLRIKRPCRDSFFTRMNRDRRPDLVTVDSERVEVFMQRRRGKRLARRPAYSRGVRRAEALAVGDVNRDGVPDIYVLRAARYDDGNPPQPGQKTDKPDLMLISKGSPSKFRRKRIPQFRGGIGDAVTAIDHDRNGQTDFVVMNGHRKAVGPVRLVAFYPR